MSKTLVAYFSYSGNAKAAAEKVAELAGADLFEIKPAEPYSTDYQACVDEARKELQENARPKLADKVEDISGYDRIILGFPNWCKTCPMPVLSFLEEYDLNGKKIDFFVTNGGGGVGDSTQDIRKSAAGAEVSEAINGNDLSDDRIKEWLKL
ncbi:MAG: flavodoxin family protein [Bacteroidales bacterium]|nr:flavodoxin [Clostridium sp.]MCM1203668.1 flavodoxin family protein [Bacteroidales bacterium]